MSPNSYAGADIHRRMCILIKQILNDADKIGYDKVRVLGMVKDEYTERGKRARVVKKVMDNAQNASY